jgi:hypothetical protein
MLPGHEIQDVSALLRTHAADSSIAPNEGLNPIVRTGDAKSIPAQGLRLLEHGTRAF